jgi:hypothetical protein
MESKRTDPRYERRVDVVLTTARGSYTGVTRNLGLGGLCAESDAPIAFGEKVQVHLQLPAQKDPIDADGEVRWVRTESDGVRLIGISLPGLRARDVWALSKFVQTPPAGTTK